MIAAALLLWACGTQSNPDTKVTVPADLPGPAAERRLTDLPPSEAKPVPTFAKQVLPIFAASCAGSSCHTGASPIAPDLNPAKAYAALVNVAAAQCPTLVQVKPGDPTQSYLMIKIDGAGSCYKGQKMPPWGLAAGDATIVRGWIAAGALNN